MDAREYRLGYRGDIEGLRAVAILLVVGAHANIPWLTGGFVGVDVFFVLSGYLITGLLLQEIDKTGQLGFLNFYARRLRRLLPALLVMLACTCIVAAIVLAPGEQGAQAIAAATASAWLSNIHFAFAKLDYFSPGAASNLFLHTWSLGVEEQFYLIWPALLWALGAQRGQDNAAARLKIVMWGIVATSLVFCLVLTRTAPQMAFYLMPLRAWQFATGALVWLYFNSPRAGDVVNKTPRVPASIGRWSGWLGLVMIVAAGLGFDANMAYPGWRALLPTIGTALIVAAGVHGHETHISRALAWAPLQALGKVSYSWYLWHWPVLLLGAVFVTANTPTYRVGLVVVSLVLATMSYRWIESPIRHQARWTSRPGVTVLAAIGLMLVANVLCILWSNASWNWVNSPSQQRYAKAATDAPVIYAMGCDDWYHSDTMRPCSFGPADAKHTVVLIGDSVGAQWFPAVATVFDPMGWRLLVLTKSSCPMVDEPFFYAKIGREYVECSNWRKRALQEITALKPDIVIMGSVQTSNFDRDQWIEGTARVLEAIGESTRHVYILRGTPQLPFNGPNCLASQSWLPWLHPHDNKCRATVHNTHGDDIYRWLQQAAARFSDVTTLDMNNAVCPSGDCAAERDGKIVFRDNQHLTATFVESLSDEFDRQLDLTNHPIHAERP